MGGDAMKRKYSAYWIDGKIAVEDLAPLLRSFHACADRGELKALLCEAWGPSASDFLSADRLGFPAVAEQPVVDGVTLDIMKVPNEDVCICTPGYGHKSDGPHPGEGVIGCDYRRDWKP
jgi:hypothetical protein